MKVNITIIASIIMISLYINVTEANINTLRTNELLFYTGHSIKDGVNEEAGMSSPIPPQVCYRETNKTGGPLNDYCSFTYSSYYLQWERPGTMNITLNTSPGGPDRVLKVITNKVIVNDTDGTPKPLDGEGGGVDGFAQYQPPTTGTCPSGQSPLPNCYNNQLSVKLAGASEVESKQGGTPADTKINRAYTSLQLGQTRYGESLWVHNDEDNEVMTISSYKAVDWSLKPVVPMGFSINAIGTTPINPVIFGEQIKLIRANNGEGSLCIDKDNSGFQNDATAWCETTKGGLYIEGNVNINRLYGEIGFVKTVYSDTNFFTGSPYTHTLPSYDNNGLDHNLAYIGFVVSEHADQNTHNYWMAVAPDSGIPDCAGGATADPGDGGPFGGVTKLSHYGKFDFQINWNMNASYMFIVMDEDTDKQDDVIKRVKFCTTGPDTGIQKSGVALYGLPKTQD